MSVSAANLAKMILNCCYPPSLNNLLEKVRIRKYPCSLKFFLISQLVACSLALAVRGGLSLRWDVRSLGVHPITLCWVQSLRSRKELEYSPTLRTLYTIAANLVAIDRYQCVCVLQARFVSVISTDDSRHLLLFAAKWFCSVFFPALSSTFNLYTCLF